MSEVPASGKREKDVYFMYLCNLKKQSAVFTVTTEPYRITMNAMRSEYICNHYSDCIG
jgi:uncharacterized protein YjhX (UPF0386 family)